jgi:CBS domain-containing protein
MPMVKDIIRQKGSDVWCVDQCTTIHDALVLMAEKNIGALVVMENNQIVGIFSERDYARWANRSQRFSLNKAIKGLMSSPVYFVNPSLMVEECMAIMTEKRFRHLPVMEAGQLVGLISIGDVVKSTLSEMDFTIKNLEDYIWVHMI